MAHVEQGDCLRAERIAGNALKILPPRPHHAKAGFQKTKLERENAYCVIDVPLTKGKPKSPKEYMEIGEALKAEKIHGEAKEIDAPQLFPRSGRHRGSRTKLKGEAFCIIEQPLLYVLQRAP
jgi:hypothetical protein